MSIIPEKNYLTKCAIYAVLMSFLLFVIYAPEIFTADGKEIFEIALNVIYRTLPSDFKYIEQIIPWLLPIIILCFMFSEIMAQDLTMTGIYIFTRKKCHASWYFSMISKLVFISYFYVTIFVAMSTLIFMINSSFFLRIFDYAQKASVYVLITGLFLSVVLLSVNLLAMRFGSHLGSAVSVCAIILMAATAIYTYDNPVKVAYISFLLNPVANAMLDWYKDFGRSVPRENSIGFVHCTLYFAFLFAVLISSGYFYVCNYDLGLENKEEE